MKRDRPADRERLLVLAVWRSVTAALRPGTAPVAALPAVRAVVAAGAIALVGVATGDLDPVGVAYFGASCAVVFITTPAYRARLVMLVAQASGAVGGICVGVVMPHGPLSVVLTALVAGMLSGAVGAIGAPWTAAALMFLVGLSFGQFAGVALPWWQQGAWYLVGTVVVAVPAVAMWPRRRDTAERHAIAALLDACADLAAGVGAPDASELRHRLAVASATARLTVPADRAARLAGRGGRSRRVAVAIAAAERVALAVAAMHAVSATVVRSASPTIRNAADDVRQDRRASRSLELADPGGEVPHVLRPLAEALDVLADDAIPRSDGPSTGGRWHRLRVGAAAAVTVEALSNGVRLAWCMGLASACVIALHEPSHSYWLPLTVAVVVRPEYASVFVRTVNRVAGTLAGAAGAAVVLLVAPGAWVVAVGAAAAIGLAVAAAPKLYAFAVVGITASALLSASIGTPDPVFPILRVLDTVIGALIAIVFGYLLWPGRHQVPAAAAIRRAADGARRYLGLVAQGGPASETAAARLSAFRLAHAARATADAALLEPPPISRSAAGLQAVAMDVEDVVDGVTALALMPGASREPERATALAERLTAAVARADDLSRRAVTGPTRRRFH